MCQGPARGCLLRCSCFVTVSRIKQAVTENMTGYNYEVFTDHCIILLSSFFHLPLSTWQNTGLLTTPSVFVIGPAPWEETGVSFQIPREGIWGWLGSGSRWGPPARARQTCGPVRGACVVGLAAGSPLLCVRGGSCGRRGDSPACPHHSHPGS